MLRNYLATALRQLVEHRLYTAINLAGLSVGLACFILIGLFVENELSYDSHWGQAERIYRISRDYFDSDRSTAARHAGMAGAAAALLKEDFHEIEKAARIFCCGAVAKAENGTQFLEGSYADADPELFEIFDFEWLRGDPATALSQPTDVVLTASAARRHFGDADPLGKALLIGGGGDDWLTLEVVGVIDDLPEETHLNISMLGSMQSWEQDEGARGYMNDWGNNVFHTYVLLRDGARIAAVEARSADFFERRLETGSSRYTGFTALSVEDIHLHSRRDDETGGPGEMKAAGSIAIVSSFAAVATFVLLLACINFMNLATARSAKRAKEIGMRKVVGAARRQIAAQFLTESVLLAVLAVLLAAMLAELALPAFNAFLGQSLSFDYLTNPRVLTALCVLTLATGIVSGSYPALYLSRFRPQQVLKGDAASGRGAASFRKLLVVVQFAIAIALLIATVSVYRQLEFVRGMELGFDKDQVVLVEPNPGGGARWETLKREWLSHPEIVSVTQSDTPPFRHNPRTAEIRADGRTRRMTFSMVDDGFFETYGIDVFAGRTFSSERGDAERAGPGQEGAALAGSFVISELAARQFGWAPAEAVGKWLEFGAVQGTRFHVDDAAGPVIGVVRDVYFESARSALQPVVYRAPGDALRAAALRITGTDLRGTLEHIEAKWKLFRPDLPVSRRFVDDDFDALYRAEERQAQMLTFFAALAVSIACLGLFGLASYTTEQRTKEIGVRKVVGGTVPDIVRLFTAGFSKLVIGASLIAWPLAYLLMQRWLAGFAYRIELGPLVFVGSALVALAVALATVGTVAARAAAAKPIDSLRYE